MKNSRNFLVGIAASIIGLTLLLASAGCKSGKDNHAVEPGATHCPNETDTLVNGQCVLKPGLVKFGNVFLNPTTRRDVYFYSASTCPAVDSFVLGLGNAWLADTMTPSGNGYILSNPRVLYKDGGIAPYAIGTGSSGPIPPNYWKDPVHGDSLRFSWFTATPRPDVVALNIEAFFAGRMDLNQDTIRGRVTFSHGSMATCENFALWRFGL